jgi:hypothetical protein
MRRVAIAVLAPAAFTPPGIAADAWRHALADDILDTLARLAEVEPAVALPGGVLVDLGWPGLRSYVSPELTVTSLLAAAAADGFDQAVLVAGDSPDLPGMVMAKLLRPLTSRPVSVAAVSAAGAAPGLLGLGSVLPAPAWLPALTLDELTPAAVRRAAPSPGDVAASGATWHRLRSAADLGRLDPRLEGWDATRALLHP